MRIGSQVPPARGDLRGFVHKRIFRGIKGFIGGGPLGAARGFISSPTPTPLPFPTLAGAGPGPAALPGCPPGFFRAGGGPCQKHAPAEFARQTALASSQTGCPPGFVVILGKCVPTSPISLISDPRAALRAPGFPPGGPVFNGPPDPFGQARVGRFGAGLEPAVRQTSTRTCPRGAVLAVDGLCYNRRDIRNSERWWPRGRRPLLTGGEMRCISVASSAAKKLQRKQKQLQELGLLKPPARRGGRRAEHVRLAPVAHN